MCDISCQSETNEAKWRKAEACDFTNQQNKNNDPGWS